MFVYMGWRHRPVEAFERSPIEDLLTPCDWPERYIHSAPEMRTPHTRLEREEESIYVRRVYLVLDIPLYFCIMCSQAVGSVVMTLGGTYITWRPLYAAAITPCHRPMDLFGSSVHTIASPDTDKIGGREGGGR